MIEKELSNKQHNIPVTIEDDERKFVIYFGRLPIVAVVEMYGELQLRFMDAFSVKCYEPFQKDEALKDAFELAVHNYKQLTYDKNVPFSLYKYQLMMAFKSFRMR